MKKLFVFVFVALLSTSVFSIDEKPAKEEIRTKIVALLGKPGFEIENDVKTTVEFLINKSGEIVILNIDCNSPEICNYVKNKLNYQIVNKEAKFNNDVYRIPLTIKGKRR